MSFEVFNEPGKQKPDTASKVYKRGYNTGYIAGLRKANKSPQVTNDAQPQDGLRQILIEAWENFHASRCMDDNRKTLENTEAAIRHWAVDMAPEKSVNDPLVFDSGLFGGTIEDAREYGQIEGYNAAIDEYASRLKGGGTE